MFHLDKLCQYMYFTLSRDNYLSIQVLLMNESIFFLLIIFNERFVNILRVCKSFCYFMGEIDKEKKHYIKCIYFYKYFHVSTWDFAFL